MASMSTSSQSWVPAVVSVAAAVSVFLWLRPIPKLDWEDGVLPDARKFMEYKGMKVSPSSETPLKGLHIAVTGATAGIGLSLTRKLAKLGATVIVIGRSASKLQRVQEELPDNVETVVADLNDLDAVAKAGDEMLKRFSHLDVLVNNAGIHTKVELLPGLTTKQGYDLCFGVNYLSHFLLTEKLMPLLEKSSKPRIVQVSSFYHVASDGSDLRTASAGRTVPVASQWGGNHGFLVFRTMRQYATSKLAQILHSRALQRRRNITAVSACPSLVGSEIAGKRGSPGHVLLSNMAFPVDGYGLSSILHAILDPTAGSPKRDFYSNTRFLGWLFQHNPTVRIARRHVPTLTYDVFPIRDTVAVVTIGVLLALQHFFLQRDSAPTQQVCYDEVLQDELYDWSQQAVSKWL